MYALNVIVLIPEKKFTAITCICNENIKPIASVKCKTYTKELNKVETIRKFQY